MPRPFAVIGFTVFLTTALLYNMKTGVTVAALAVFTAALVVTLFIGKARKQRYFPCAFASGAVACALLLSSIVFLYQPAAALDGSTREITATLTSEAELKYGNYYYTAKATRIDGEEVDLKLRLTFSSQPEAEPYDEVSGNFTFYIPGSSSEDFIASYKADGIYIAAYPRSDTYTVNNIPESEKPIGKKIIDIRKGIKNAIYRVLPDERGALAVALIIGDKSGLSSDILNDFQTAGISHVICVSGFHLSLWSMLIFGILKKLKTGEKPASVICAFAVVGFMLVSGLTYSVVRSGIMMLVYLLSNLLMRQRDSLNSLGFALTVIAVFNPFAMGSVSLQLSALATLGIILYSQNLAPLINQKLENLKIKPIKKMLNSALSSLMITVSATAFTLPVSLNIYGGFNFAVFAANFVAVPVSSAAMVICAVGAIIGRISASIFNVAACFGGKLCGFLIWFADAVADIKWLSFRIESDESALIICAVLAVCLFSLTVAYFGKSMPVLTCVVSGIVFTVLLLTFSLSEQGITKIKAVDCGNGTSVVISKGGETLLIGCGGTEFLGSMYVTNAADDSGGDIDAMIIPGISEFSSAYLNKILLEHKPDKIYCSELDRNSLMLLTNSEILGLGSEYSSEKFTVKGSEVGSSFCTLVKSDDVSVLICFGPIENYSLFPEDFRFADVIITRGDYPKEIEKFGSRLVVLNAENTRGKLISDELNAMGITAAATAGNGSIIIKADEGCISAFREY